jgi:hypothetical protein
MQLSTRPGYRTNHLKEELTWSDDTSCQLDRVEAEPDDTSCQLDRVEEENVFYYREKSTEGGFPYVQKSFY